MAAKIRTFELGDYDGVRALWQRCVAEGIVLRDVRPRQGSELD